MDDPRAPADDAAFDLLVLGELNADLLLGGDVEPAFGQEERLLSSADLVLGGSGAITACGAARLGLRVAYAGLVGDDLVGRFVLDELRAKGVDTRWVVRAETGSSGLGVILSRPDGDRAILTYPGLIPVFSPKDVPAAALAAARHVHVGAYFLQTGLHAGLPGLLAAHARRGGTSSLDPNWDPAGTWELDAVLPHLELLLPNAEEARRLARTDDPDAAAEVLAARGPALAVKNGASGALFRDAHELVRVGAATGIRAVDATGAGDSFDAGFLAGFLEGLGPAASLALGNACGALSTRAVGGTAAQPTRAEADALADELLDRSSTA